MSTVIAAYHPSTTLIVTTTPMNMKETSPSTLYETPIPGKVIVRCDIFAYLSKYFGDTMLKDRQRLYTIFSQSKVTDKEYCSILAHCYRRYSSFANLIDDIYYFGDEAIPFAYRVKERLMSLVEEARSHFGAYNGKFVMENEGYLYYCFQAEKVPTEIYKEKGVTVYV